MRTVPRPRSSAVTWIDRSRAVVARTTAFGAVDVTEIVLSPSRPEAGPALARVADVIGDRERVLITGTPDMRTALEREYVAIYRRPERLIDVEPAAPMTRAELVARTLELAG
jgi:hypothetical protein